MHITLNTFGETPAKKNSKIFNTKTKRMFPSARYAEWHKATVDYIKSQLPVDFVTIDKTVDISMTFFHEDKRKRDCDNGCSSILDTLVDAGVIVDDNWFVVRQVHLYNEMAEKKDGRCVISIKTLDD